MGGEHGIDRLIFRQAAEAPAWRNLAKTFVQVAVFWSVLLWIIPSLIVAAERARLPSTFGFTPWPRTGWVIFLLASAVGIWSAVTMARHGRGTPLPLDHPRALVACGPYAHIRNPMAAAGLTQGAAVGLMFGSAAVLLYVAAGGLFWNYAVRPVEERSLVLQFGEPFEQYRRAVRCWVPRMRPYSDRTQRGLIPPGPRQ